MAIATRRRTNGKAMVGELTDIFTEEDRADIEKAREWFDRLLDHRVDLFRLQLTVEPDGPGEGGLAPVYDRLVVGPRGLLESVASALDQLVERFTPPALNIKAGAPALDKQRQIDRIGGQLAGAAPEFVESLGRELSRIGKRMVANESGSRVRSHRTSRKNSTSSARRVRPTRGARNGAKRG